jgi:hypothetical protein
VQANITPAATDPNMISNNGKWEFRRDLGGDIQTVGVLERKPEKGPRGTNPVDGLRQGAMHLLNS